MGPRVWESSLGDGDVSVPNRTEEPARDQATSIFQPLVSEKGPRLKMNRPGRFPAFSASRAGFDPLDVLHGPEPRRVSPQWEGGPHAGSHKHRAGPDGHEHASPAPPKRRAGPLGG